MNYYIIQTQYTAVRFYELKKEHSAEPETPKYDMTLAFYYSRYSKT